MSQRKRVYVSSTFIDLEDYRAKVNERLRRAGYELVAMEDYPAFDERPLDKCLKDVASCDFFVGILAKRYGFVPDVDNPDRLSICEREYLQATEAGRPRLMFLLDPKAPWLEEFDDRLVPGSDAGASITRYRAHVGKAHGNRFFSEPEQLAGLVLEAIAAWEKAHPEEPAGGRADEVTGESERSLVFDFAPQNFVGRADSLDQLAKWLLEGAGPALLYGPPGYGKSYLAQQFLASQQAAFRAVIFQPCGRREVATIAHEMFMRLNRARPHGRPITSIAELQDWIGTRRTLLVLDDVWNDDVQSLVNASGFLNQQLSVLVTSQLRQFAWIPRNRSLEVVAFTDQESLALFSHFLGAQTTHEHRDKLLQLARRAGQLPFAVALAAETLASRLGPVADEANRLTPHQLSSATGNVKDLFSRAIESCSADEQRLLQAIAVCNPEAVYLPLALAVARLDGSAASDIRDRLAGTSLLTVIDRDQQLFRLPSLLHEYLLATIPADELDTLIERHASLAPKFAEDIPGALASSHERGIQDALLALHRRRTSHSISEAELDAMQSEVANLLSRFGVARKPKRATEFSAARFLADFIAAGSDETQRILLEPSNEEAEALRQFYGDSWLEHHRALARSRVERLRASNRRGTVILIPGWMGSHLATRSDKNKSRRIWMNYLALASGAAAKLALPTGPASPVAGLVPDGLMEMFYGPMQAALQANWQVQPFAYDWRLSHTENAHRLADFVRQQDLDGPCHLLAHAEGAPLARAFIKHHGDLWERMAGGRLVMIAPTNHGSFQALTWLRGESPTLKKLAMLDLRHDAAEIRSIFASFPALYEQLPSPLLRPSWNSLYQQQTFGSLEVPQELLERGRAFHESVLEIVDPDRMVQVIGQGVLTIADIAFDDRGKARYVASMAGDGSVTLEMALLRAASGRSPITYAIDGEYHSSIMASTGLLRVIDELLRTGTTPGLKYVLADATTTLSPEDKLTAAG